MTRRRWLVLAAVVVVLAGASVGLLVDRTSTTAGTGSTTDARPTTIPASGGISLAGFAYTPAGADHALIVMPIPYGSPGTAYAPLASAFAKQGYEVITYLQRGFHQSGGQVDFAGPATQRDASTVISWALANTPADPKRVGMLGMSYGGATALLAAARDPRIRAVVAVHTWTDFAQTFDPNATASTAVLAVLAKEAGSRLDPSVQPLASSASTTGFGAVVQRLAGERSPQSYLAQLNRNRPAILIMNALADSYIPPLQLVRFFAGLTGPKRLELAPGDHETLDYSALRDPKAVGSVVPHAAEWLDHYLRGAANGVESWQPVQLTDETTGVAHELEAWPTAATAASLGTPDTTGDLGAGASWSASLPADRDSGADFGALGDGAGFRLASPASWTGGSYLSWTSAAFSHDVSLAGTPSLHLRVSSSTTTATLFAYLYEVTPSGTAALITGEPYTATGLAPGVARTVSIELEPVAWTLLSGDHLELAIDTADPRFASSASGTITLSSTGGDPATLSLPS